MRRPPTRFSTSIMFTCSTALSVFAAVSLVHAVAYGYWLLAALGCISIIWLSFLWAALLALHGVKEGAASIGSLIGHTVLVITISSTWLNALLMKIP